MPVIRLETLIRESPATVFDLARSIDLHTISTQQTSERAVAGVTSGLIGMGESVTWEARHFGVKQRLMAMVTAYDRPHYFVDEMQEGVFRSFHHTHRFVALREGTLMQDVFDYTSPLGVLGRLADRIFLNAYMTHLLRRRNKVIKDYAESGDWRDILEAKPVSD
ncbi:hypothetical protein LEM8419_00006 [Neolewinella maritima]|uniref:Cell division protein n=1 Tax=Neolewinella maritima TaxID=1383882 RepID=A0ABM9AVK0_9BACT|nr:SRPBCC family protein [Neolewinella maritima]CAH0998661.1 hypothetical protein LEM8419_00006 [Neolewinella maritima]